MMGCVHVVIQLGTVVTPTQSVKNLSTFWAQEMLATAGKLPDLKVVVL